MINTNENESIIKADAFRAILFATSYPGSIEKFLEINKPKQISTSSATILSTVCDHTSAIYIGKSLDTKSLRDWVAFHTNSKIVDKKFANFAIGTFNDMLPLTEFSRGSDEFPDRSCTLIIETPFKSDNVSISGPGIKGSKDIYLPHANKISDVNNYFPLGIDFYFTNKSNFFCIPRSIKIKKKG